MSIVITGLIEGTEYTVAVKAVNEEGEGGEGKSNAVIITREYNTSHLMSSYATAQ